MRASSVQLDRVQLDRVTREATVSIRVVRGLIDAVEAAGVPRIDVLRAARLTPEQLDVADARMPRSEVYRLCELAIELTGDEALGLHWGEKLPGNTFNPLSDLIHHAATLREGFESLARFNPLLSDRRSYQLLEDEACVTLRFASLRGESLRTQRFVAEMLATGFVRLIRAFSVHARPERVNFEYPAPAYRSEYARVFDGSAHFDQPFTGVVFDRGLMNLASPYKDADLHGALRSVAERRIVRLTQSMPYAVRVREFIVQQAHACFRVEMKTVAASLGLSVRSLRRRLAAEGRTFSVIANDAFAIVAKQLLRDKQRTIQETAYEMGFADTSAFHRSFRRWTGTTPRAFRDDASGR